jgi:hypothetical protein
MTIDELRTQLKLLGIREDSYCLNGASDEAYCLEQSSGGWVVYYSERGMKSGKRDFRSESEACEYLKAALASDSSTRCRLRLSMNARG